MLQTNKIYNMDCIEGMKQLEDNSVDSIVTDPPYDLTSQRVYSTKKEINDIKGIGQLRKNIENNTAYGSIVKGFMGKEWDGTGIAFDVNTWKEAFRVLKPGGYLLSFGGTRTYHRMACAIEDAGFEIRDQIQWIYGSGFPKSLNIGKAIDKLQGNEREILKTETRIMQPSNSMGGGVEGQKIGTRDITKGTSEFEGWGTALKPANEPICVARKPLAEKTVAENVLKYGTGGINIDECRIPTNENRNREQKEGPLSSKYGFNNNSMGNRFVELSPIGRFPANFIHDGSPEVLELFPELGKSAGGRIGKKDKSNIDFGLSGNYIKGDPGFGDSGSAARFFYCAKASKSERNAGLDGFEDKQYSYDGRNKEIENPYQRNKSIARNNHPTVKPLKLMEYLVKLVTPKGGVCLDPFMGSGTTAVACKKNGFNYLGFDMTKEYVEIAEARIKATECQKKLLDG